MRSLLWVAASAFLVGPATKTFAQTVSERQSVYEYVVRSADGAVESVTDSLRTALESAGWQVVGVAEPGSPESCSFTSRVLIGYRPGYGDVVARANPLTGAFGVVDRINVFEDEEGVHVSVVNQRSIIRTVLMNDGGYTGFVHSHMEMLREAIQDAISGTPSNRQYGQMRDKGYIGRTMGVVAGGSFDGKVEELELIKDKTLSSVADLVQTRLETTGDKWGTEFSYRLDMPSHELVLFGTAGSPLDSRSFEIVGAGSDDAREDFACPGLAHAGAYPLEVVVASTETGVAIRMVDAMYRMKMYFEDAGKIAFMKNMTMPGSIASEIEDKLVAEPL